MKPNVMSKTKPFWIYDFRMTIDDLKTRSDTWRESKPIGMGRFHSGDGHPTKINQSLVTRRHCVMARQASSATHRLNGTRVGESAFQARIGFDQPSPGYGPARRRENSRLFPPFPPLTAFDRLWGIFLVFGGEASLGNFRRDGVSTRAPRDPRDAGATRENEASARQAGGEGDFWVAVECAPTDEGGKGPGFRRQAVLAFGAKGVHAQDAYFAGRTDSSRH
jgi:hypothetical protein